MIRTKLLCLILLFLLSPVVQAIRVPGLYEVEVAVGDQSEKERIAGLQTAFRIMLIKLTGDRQAPGRSALQPLLQQADRYLQQFRYREVRLAGESGTGEPKNIVETRLWVKFDENNLNQALRNLSVPVWGRERPSTLLWLAVSDQDGRRLVGLDEAPEYVQIVEERAMQRGIVLIYPLLDLDDSAALRASDIWGGFQQPVLAASERYHADAILTVALESPVPGIWEAQWNVYINNQVANWTSESDLPQAALDEGIDNLADILAAKFARTTVFAGVNEIRLSVADIFNADQYASVLNYLGSLNSVTDVEVLQVEEGKVTFVLQIHGGELAVTQAIALGRVLAAIGSSGDGNYRLVP